ncbi:MAG: TonB-dependent receptor [Alistipes sp.]|nr:TonB-dependent receptor [Alistipes sp.]MDE5906706.1 TonB-dependent receptor [Alistipes sp.]
MKRSLLLLAALLAGLSLQAQRPLYIVNGVPCDEVTSIAPDDIETVDELPADEETIARYGERAAGGVIRITLRYDVPATFSDTLSFADYVTREVKWAADEPAARVSLRYRVLADGSVEIRELLESTDNRLKRRILKAMAGAPRWEPAYKNGAPVETEHVLTLRLPEGKRMPREPYLRMR